MPLKQVFTMWDVITLTVVHSYLNTFIKVACTFSISSDLLYDFFEIIIIYPWMRLNIAIEIIIHKAIHDIHEGIHGVIGWMDVNQIMWNHNETETDLFHSASVTINTSALCLIHDRRNHESLCLDCVVTNQLPRSV